MIKNRTRANKSDLGLCCRHQVPKGPRLLRTLTEKPGDRRLRPNSASVPRSPPPRHHLPPPVGREDRRASRAGFSGQRGLRAEAPRSRPGQETGAPDAPSASLHPAAAAAAAGRGGGGEAAAQALCAALLSRLREPSGSPAGDAPAQAAAARRPQSHRGPGGGQTGGQTDGRTERAAAGLLGRRPLPSGRGARRRLLACGSEPGEPRAASASPAAFRRAGPRLPPPWMSPGGASGRPLGRGGGGGFFGCRCSEGRGRRRSGAGPPPLAAPRCPAAPGVA